MIEVSVAFWRKSGRSSEGADNLRNRLHLTKAVAVRRLRRCPHVPLRAAVFRTPHYSDTFLSMGPPGTMHIVEEIRSSTKIRSAISNIPPGSGCSLPEFGAKKYFEALTFSFSNWKCFLSSLTLKPSKKGRHLANWSLTVLLFYLLIHIGWKIPQMKKSQAV